MTRAHIHALVMVFVSGALVVAANALSNMSDALTAHPVTFRAVFVGILTGALSRTLGAAMADYNKPAPPSQPPTQ